VHSLLSSEQFSRLSGTGFRTLDAGQTLFVEGDHAQSVYGIFDGCIKLYKMLPDGRRQIIEFLFAPDLIGFPVRVGCYAFTAEAATRTKVSCVSTGRVEQLVHESPALAKRLLEFVSDELAFAQRHLLLLGRKTALERLASFLFMLLQRQAAKGDCISLSMSQTDIADYLGLCPETVCRALAELRRKGAIRFQHSDQITISNRMRLVALAGLEDERGVMVQSRNLRYGS